MDLAQRNVLGTSVVEIHDVRVVHSKDPEGWRTVFGKALAGLRVGLVLGAALSTQDGL